jgi:hypothetical protein
MGLLAKRSAGQRLKTNMIANAKRSHPAIDSMVKPVTRGCSIRIMTVINTPKEIPTGKLENNTVRVCSAR